MTSNHEPELLDRLVGRGLDVDTAAFMWFKVVKQQLDRAVDAALEAGHLPRYSSRKEIYAISLLSAMMDSQANLHDDSKAAAVRYLRDNLLAQYCSEAWYRDRSQKDTTSILTYMEEITELIGKLCLPGQPVGVCASIVIGCHYLSRASGSECVLHSVEHVSATHIAYLALSAGYRWWVERKELGFHAQTPLPFSSLTKSQEYLKSLGIKHENRVIDNLEALRAGSVIQEVGPHHPVDIWKISAATGEFQTKLFIDGCSYFDYREPPCGMIRIAE